MTLSHCDAVTERLALGESLAELTEHVATCTSCQHVVAMSRQLGATHHAVDPGLGFSARMTIGAQHRLAVRRRRRLAAGLAATVATGALSVLFVTRTPEPLPSTVSAELSHHGSSEQPTEEPALAGDDDLAALAQFADVDRASRLSARWSHIKKPLAAYKKLLKEVTP